MGDEYSDSFEVTTDMIATRMPFVQVFFFCTSTSFWTCWRKHVWGWSVGGRGLQHYRSRGYGIVRLLMIKRQRA